MHDITTNEIAALVSAVDYSEALTLTAGEKEVRDACLTAREHGFRAVVAFPQYLGILVDELKGSGVLAQIPVSFPCGGNSTDIKCREAEEGLNRGAGDLDMVMNLSAFGAGEYRRVSDDIKAVMKVAEPFGVPFKVIIEIGLWTDDQIVTASKLVVDCGADFIKTCTGYGPGRATVHAINLLKKSVGNEIRIKASGGVAGLEDGVAFMRAGASVVAERAAFVQHLADLDWTRNSG